MKSTTTAAAIAAVAAALAAPSLATEGPARVIASSDIQTAESICAARAHDVDLPGNDIGSRSTIDSTDCESDCLLDPNCRAWTWSDTNGGTCRLKGGYGHATLVPGAVSGVKMSCDEPPHSKYLIVDNCDVPGNDVGNSTGRSYADCTTGANAFTWSDWNGGTCWYKYTFGSCEYAPNKFTGVLLWDYLVETTEPAS